MMKIFHMISSSWTILRCVVATAIPCFKTLFTFQKRLPREQTDKIIRDWAQSILSIIKVNLVIKNPYNTTFEPHKRYILMCNHTSVFDIPLTYAALQDISIRMLAKKELTNIPVFRTAIFKTHTPTIDRHNRQQAIKDLESARRLMDEGYVLWIAPEGTRSLSGKLKPFKKGGFITAIEAQAEIIPIAINDAHTLCDYKHFIINKNQTVDVVIGKPIDSTQYSSQNKNELLQHTFHEMNELLCKEQKYHQKTT